MHLTLVRSPLAHATITSIDTSAALAAPGVVAVVTGADLDIAPALLFPGANKAMPRPFLATDRVRFVGEPVAAVLTEEYYQGEDAAELVDVEYEPLDVVIDPLEAVRDETLLFPEAGTNTAAAYGFEEEPDASFFDGCEVVVTRDLVNQRLAAARWRRARRAPSGRATTSPSTCPTRTPRVAATRSPAGWAWTRTRCGSSCPTSAAASARRSGRTRSSPSSRGSRGSRVVRSAGTSPARRT